MILFFMFEHLKLLVHQEENIGSFGQKFYKAYHTG
jgi:hypothetical protein